MAGALTVMQLLPALERGGVERSTVEIAAALVAAGDRAIVVSSGGALLPALRATGAEHIDLAIGRKSPWTLRHVWTLRRLFRRLRPDIVHLRSRLPAWLAWLAWRGLPRGQRPRLVTTVHGLNSVNRYSAVMTRGERVIAVSQTVRRHLLAHYGVDATRIVVIPRGIDPARWPPGHRPDAAWREAFARDFPNLAGRRLLLLPGRGTRLKGHAEAIDLLARLLREGRDVGLLLLGVAAPGREAYVQALASMARTAGVADHVVFAPPRSDVREFMAQADLVLQLSTRPESFGRTVIEALALGRPVLGFDHGGVGELLAALYPAGAVAPGDRDALQARAAALLDAAPPAQVPADYHLATMQSRTLALYRELAAWSPR